MDGYSFNTLERAHSVDTMTDLFSAIVADLAAVVVDNPQLPSQEELDEACPEALLPFTEDSVCTVIQTIIVKDTNDFLEQCPSNTSWS